MIEKMTYSEYEEHYTDLYGQDWRDNELLIDQMEQELHQQNIIADYINSGEAEAARKYLSERKVKETIVEPESEAIITE